MSALRHKVGVILICQFLISACSPTFLDPKVFQNLSSLQLPMVGLSTALRAGFSFETSENELLDCVTSNATYQTNLERIPYMILHIPNTTVDMVGKYSSSLNLQLSKGERIYLQSNSGEYKLSLKNVTLHFEISFRCKLIIFADFLKFFISSSRYLLTWVTP